MRKWLTTNTIALIASREKEGLKPVDLARKLRVDKSYIHYIEKGERQPSYKLGRRMARALGVPMEAIFQIHMD